MQDFLDLGIDFHANPDIVIAENLGRQLAEDDCSDIEITETITEAFPDADLQIVAFIQVLLTQNAMRAKKAHRLHNLQRWNQR